MEAPLIRFQSPILPSVDVIGRYFARAEERRWYSNSGPCHDLLVQRLERLEVDRGLHCVPLSNATSALM